MAEDAPQQRDPRIAWEGCSVLLDINDGDRLVFARLSPSSTLKIGNKKCSLGPLIGCPFGSLFRLEVGASGAFLSRDSSSSAGTGSICSTYYGTKPYPMDIIGIFNFDCEIWSRIFCVAASDFCLAQEMNFQNSGSASNRKPPSSVSDVDNGVLDLVASDDSTSTPTSENVIQQDSSMKSDNHNEGLADEKSVNLNGILGTNVSTDDGFEGIDCKNIRTPNGAKYGRHPSLAYIDLWKQNGFSSLIMAAPDLDPWNIVQELLPLLSYSAPFAIYHQYLQPLAVCMHNMQAEKIAVGLQISEPWLREYQVLPSRTHPAMQMSAFGGYILSGTRICRDNICLDNC